MVLGVFRLGCFDYWKQIAVQGLAPFQLTVLELMERRRHDTSAALEGDVVASPAKGDGAAPQVRRAVAWRAVHSTEMERGAVARLQIKRDDPMLVPFGIDSGHDLEAVSAHRIVITNEHLRLEQAPPPM